MNPLFVVTMSWNDVIWKMQLYSRALFRKCLKAEIFASSRSLEAVVVHVAKRDSLFTVNSKLMDFFFSILVLHILGIALTYHQSNNGVTTIIIVGMVIKCPNLPSYKRCCSCSGYPWAFSLPPSMSLVNWCLLPLSVLPEKSYLTPCLTPVCSLLQSLNCLCFMPGLKPFLIVLVFPVDDLMLLFHALPVALLLSLPRFLGSSHAYLLRMNSCLDPFFSLVA